MSHDSDSYCNSIKLGFHWCLQSKLVFQCFFVAGYLCKINKIWSKLVMNFSKGCYVSSVGVSNTLIHAYVLFFSICSPFFSPYLCFCVHAPGEEFLHPSLQYSHHKDLWSKEGEGRALEKEQVSCFSPLHDYSTTSVHSQVHQCRMDRGSISQ